MIIKKKILNKLTGLGDMPAQQQEEGVSSQTEADTVGNAENLQSEFQNSSEETVQEGSFC